MDASSKTYKTRQKIVNQHQLPTRLYGAPEEAKHSLSSVYQPTPQESITASPSLSGRNPPCPILTSDFIPRRISKTRPCSPVFPPSLPQPITASAQDKRYSPEGVGVLKELKDELEIEMAIRSLISFCTSWELPD
ncbi:hypothetical protein B9Z19DRAFT_1123763 [Tuber borchii]|uniref:Uncharacterized protein n=1 Tax=Tuber borchii TaxID=42251 RepID=A0A2T6ZXX6_TUBBO|nr:hypothetical protein B9Z19DRAFT_1123763 [Tuber borchii]